MQKGMKRLQIDLLKVCDKYRISHELLTVDIKFYLTSLEKCYQASFGEFNNIFKTSLINYLSQQPTYVRFFLSHN